MANSIMASSKPLISLSSSTQPTRVNLPKSIKLPQIPKPISSSLSSKALSFSSATVKSLALIAALAPPSMAEAMEKAQLFDFNLTLPIIVVEFLFLMFALDKVYYSPLGNFMDKRDGEIKEKLASVKDTSAEVKELDEQAAAVMRAARAEIAAALNKMKKETQVEVEEQLAVGRKKVEAELQEALASLEKQKEETIKALDSQIAALSEDIVKKVRGQPLPRFPVRNHRMINTVVCGFPIISHHRVSNVLSRTSGPFLGYVPARTDENPFLRGDSNGRFGKFGGKFVPETLMSCLRDLEDEFNFVLSDHEFQVEFTAALRDYVGRETPLYFAERLTQHYKNIARTTGDGPEIYLKREDLCHGGSHKINNALAQAMIARRLGCSRVVAATGSGQHGVATAAACAKLSLECTVFMGTTDIEKQSSNVLSMKLLGAQVKSVQGTFQDASSEAIRNWVGKLETTYYLPGTVVGPHPSPVMVREFQSVIGKETRRQAKQLWGGKPDVLVACVGSGSNALGLFHEFVRDEDVRLVGVEAAGLGLDSGKHSATLAVGDVGVYHGSMSYLLQDDQGQILRPHSIGVGLEYPGVGPEISFLKESGRAEFCTATDQEAIQACMLLSRLEGIIPALETSHALAILEKLVPTLRDGAKVVVNCSGRGDKDINTLIQRGMPSSLC